MEEKKENIGWKSFRNGTLNSGEKIVEQTPVLSEPWQFKTDGLIWSTPVIDEDGNIYIGSADKWFYAIDRNGKLLWKYKIHDLPDALIDSAATITQNNKIIVPGGDGYLHALNIKTGEKLWEFRAYHAGAEQIKSGGLVNSFEGNVVEGPGGRLYAGSDNGHMYCISQNGEEFWNFNTGMMIWSAPVFEPGGQWMCFGSLDGFLYLLNPETGGLLDKLNLGEIKASPAYEPVSKLLFAGNTSGTMYALKVSNNKLVKHWAYKTQSEIYSSACYNQNNLYFGSTNGQLYALTTEGKHKWKYNTNSAIYSSPAVVNNSNIIFGAVNGKIYALDLSGKRIWSFKTSEFPHKANLDSSVAISNQGQIAVGSYNGNIYSLPVGYCATHQGDVRTAFGGTEDIPHSPGNPLRFEDRDRKLVEHITVGLSEPLKIRLIIFENGKFIRNAAINSAGLLVKISPEIKFRYLVSSNGHFLNIFPDDFWDENTSYKIEIKTSYYKKEHVIKDRFKWFMLPKVHQTLEFSTQKLSPQADVVPVHEFGLENFSLYQPLNINGLVAAGLDGQKFILRFSQNPDQTIKMNLAPASKQDGTFKAMPERNLDISFAVKFRGNYFHGNGGLMMFSAMGATFPVKQSIITGEVSDGKIKNGIFFGIVSGLSLRGNDASYKFPVNLISETCDHRLNITVMQGFDGEQPNSKVCNVL